MRLAIIPARGGSKRIPRKNIKFFHGRPIIAYSIEAALVSGCFDKVIVSTDCQEISDIAISFGAESPFVRPNDISDDFSTTMDVVHHAISWYEGRGVTVGDVCCIYATAPFVTASDLVKGYQQLTEMDEVQFVFSATTFPFPIQRALKLNAKGEVCMFNPENELVRSQDLEEAYHDAGQFYWGKKNAFLHRRSIFSSHSRVVVIPRKRVQDIDTLEDWQCAEALYALMK